MKSIRVYMLFFVALLSGSAVQSQNFSVSFPDTIVYGAALDSNTISCWVNDNVTNLTENPLVMDVVRVQNDTGTPGWTSSFCFQFCSLSGVDSIRATMQPNEVVNIAIHFHVTGIPDTGTVLMKFQNVNDTSEVIYQRFYGITTPASVGALTNASAGMVSCYPLPAQPQQEFTMNLEGQKFAGQTVTLEVYDVFGRKVATEVGMHEGANKLNLDLSAGMYTYSLSVGKLVVDTGKLVFAD